MGTAAGPDFPGKDREPPPIGAGPHVRRVARRHAGARAKTGTCHALTEGVAPGLSKAKHRLRRLAAAGGRFLPPCHRKHSQQGLGHGLVGLALSPTRWRARLPYYR